MTHDNPHPHLHPNVDPAEVKKFDEMAAQWWDPEGECKPLHDLNPLRLAFILSCCPLTNQTILDVGCGGGILTEAMSQCAAQVTGIDQSIAALKVAKAHAESLATPPVYEQITVEDLAQRTQNTFDVITCMELLEHVPSPLSVIQACTQLLKPNGHLFFSTLNRTPKAFLHAIIGAEYILRLLPKGTHLYERFIKPSELKRWTHDLPLDLKHIKGIRYRLWDKSYYLSEDVSVNYLLHFQKREAE